MTSRYVGRHQGSAFKVELFLVDDEPYSRERFAGRRHEPFLGTFVFLPSPEDVIVQKLRWFGRARRAKDREDVVNVMAVQKGKLDLDSIRRWCDRHGTRDLLDKLLAKAD